MVKKTLISIAKSSSFRILSGNSEYIAEIVLNLTLTHISPDHLSIRRYKFIGYSSQKTVVDMRSKK